MNDSKECPLSFSSGYVESRDACLVVSEVDQTREMGGTSSAILKWEEGKGWKRQFPTHWTVSRVCLAPGGEPGFIAFGPDGFAHSSTKGVGDDEIIDDSPDGPKGAGDLVDFRPIGKRVYAAGMSRRVYRRDKPNKWVPIDKGVVKFLKPGELDPTGFNSIHGLDESDIFAVGFGGEIWERKKSKWKQWESPTNVVLNCVRVGEGGQVYACGQEGVLLSRQDEGWKVIGHDFDIDLWGLEWFNGILYIAAGESLLRISGDSEIEEVDTGLKDWIFTHLHSRDGVMWSFGRKHLAWTKDGETWNDVTPYVKK